MHKYIISEERGGILRITIEFELISHEIPKDKGKMFASWLKNNIEKYDKEMYNLLYKSGPKDKEFTYSIYLGQNVKFNKDTITVPNDYIKVFFSCYDLVQSIHFFNIFTESINKLYSYKDTDFIARKIFIEKEEVFLSGEAIFKAVSPIIVREHYNNDNENNYFHNLDTEKGKQVLEKNIKHRLFKKFGEKSKYDLDNINIEVLGNRMVTVRHHNINIPSNLCVLKVHAKEYILKYLYYSGTFSSLNASGFGMVRMVK